MWGRVSGVLRASPGPASPPRRAGPGTQDGRTSSHLSAPPRVAACSVQNQELQKKVQELERHNM